MFFSSKTRNLTIFLAYVGFHSHTTRADTIRLKINDTIALGNALPITKNVAGLSIEFCYAIEFLGDFGKPNYLSRQLLQNIEDKLGEPPLIRIGGNTQDRAKYCDQCNDTLNNIFPPYSTESSNTTFNANLFRVMAENLSPKQKYIFGINLGLNNVSIPLSEIAALQRSPAKDMVWAYELGNEPDYFASKRPNGWSPNIYATQLVNWYKQFVTYNPAKSLPGFQLFSFASPPGSWFTIDGLVDLNVPQQIRQNDGVVKSLSDHAYPYSVCDPTRAAQVSLPGLMNHTATSQYFSNWKSAITASHKTVGTKFHMGETGSVSCHGQEGVSNTFGAALWQIDYVLYGATIGMDRIFFHQGIPYFYSAWWPSMYKGATPTVWPTYYSFLFLADTVAGLRQTSIYQAFTSDSLAIYAIYASRELTRMVILNLDFWNASDHTMRPCYKIDISNIFNGTTRARRLVGNESSETLNVTWAGQSYFTGKSNGSIHFENVEGIVDICASEALLVEKL